MKRLSMMLTALATALSCGSFRDPGPEGVRILQHKPLCPRAPDGLCEGLRMRERGL